MYNVIEFVFMCTPPPSPHGLHHNTDQLYEMAEFMNLIYNKKFPLESLWEEYFTFKYALERQLMQKII